MEILLRLEGVGVGCQAPGFVLRIFLIEMLIWFSSFLFVLDAEPGTRAFPWLAVSSPIPPK